MSNHIFTWMPMVFRRFSWGVCTVFLAFHAKLAIAAPYSWSWVAGAPYPSASSACNAYVAMMAPTRNLVVSRISDTQFLCMYEYYAYGAGQWAPTSKRVNRIGTDCGIGRVFNPETGECVNGERGMPPVEMCAGNPINFSNGNKYQVENDFNSGGVAPLTFDRHYNSIDGLWRSKYSTRLEIIGVDIKLTTTDGRESFLEEALILRQT